MKNKIISISLASILLSSFCITAYAEQLPPTLGDISQTDSGVVSTPADAGAVATPEATPSTPDAAPAALTDQPKPAKAFQDFSDVPVTDPNYTAIIVLRYQGVINGYPDNTFHPAKSLNRVEALKLIFEATQMEMQTGVAPAKFTDTESNAWYSGYLNRALFLEVINGYADGTFRPENEVNLVEFLKMLEIAQKVDLSDVNLNQLAYADTMPGQWYTKYVNYAKIHKLLTPDADNKIFPDKSVTRAQAAEIIYRFRNVLSRPVASTPAGNDTPALIGPVLLKDMALYVSSGYHFALQYPKLWFYATIDNPSADDIRTYGFGPKDLATNPPLVNLELLPDNKNFTPNLVYKTYNYQREEANGVVSFTTKIDGSTRLYRFSGSAAQEEEMLNMLTSLTSDITGLESFNPAEKPAETPAP